MSIDRILSTFVWLVVSYQKEKLKKPKGSANPPFPSSFDMHFSLRGTVIGGERGGDQFKWRQTRGTPKLLRLISNQRGEGLPWWYVQDNKIRVDQSELKRNATFGTPVVIL